MTREVRFLDDDPYQSIEAMYDVDAVGMPITITQILLTVWHRVKPGAMPKMLDLKVGDDPWIDWVVESKSNYEGLWNYGMDLLDEHFHRFGSRATSPYRHGSTRTMNALQSVPDLPDVGPTPSPSKGRDGYKKVDRFHTHTHREVPEWLL